MGAFGCWYEDKSSFLWKEGTMGVGAPLVPRQKYPQTSESVGTTILNCFSTFSWAERKTRDTSITLDFHSALPTELLTRLCSHLLIPYCTTLPHSAYIMNPPNRRHHGPIKKLSTPEHSKIPHSPVVHQTRTPLTKFPQSQLTLLT